MDTSPFTANQSTLIDSVATSAFVGTDFENAANLVLLVIRPLSNEWGRERDDLQSIRIDGFLSASA